MTEKRPPAKRHVLVAARVLWTVTTFLAVQTLACALAALPVTFFWRWLLGAIPLTSMRLAAMAAAGLVPSYIAFAILLSIVSPLLLRALAWQTPRDVAVRIADFEWPLLHWIRYGASLHVVRVIAGTWFRGTPLWTLHLRLAGARLGRRVYVNSLHLADYNLLEFGDDVVIGEGAHVAGHTVEGGVLKTAPVRLGRGVTIGVDSMIEIGITIGDRAQIGAMSFVPKHAVLPGDVVYAGTPAAPIG
jgi:hypothetical protein